MPMASARQLIEDAHEDKDFLMGIHADAINRELVAVVKDFVLDIEAAYPDPEVAMTGDDTDGTAWPDLFLTYTKAKDLLQRTGHYQPPYQPPA